ncbi:MAG: hypothetical protein V4476_00245 [Pseudomonadota bacterium]
MDELFGAVVSCCEDFCRGGRQKVRFYSDDQEVDLLGGGHQRLLPVRRDGSFAAYNARLMDLEGLPNYALVVADWHQFDRALWERILSAVQDLAAVVGISHARMDTQVFLGTYKTTPFGVHVDRTSGFHFPVAGTKTMRFWPDRFAQATPELRGALRYERYLEQSTALSARPGQVLYWPSSDWHVAESDGEFSVTWGFGYWLGDGMTSLALEELAQLLMESPGRCRAVPRAALVEEARDLREVDTLVGKLARLAVDPRLRAAVARGWLEHFSACGYLRPPPLLEHIGAAGVVTLKSMYNILAAPEAGGAMRVAAGGYSTTVADQPAVWDAIAVLNAGGELPVRGDDGAVGRMIDFCLRAGALQQRPDQT